MEDIEDIIQTDEVTSERIEKGIIPNRNFRSEKHSSDVDDHKSVVPGVQKIYMKTYGCSHNVSDSEYMVTTVVL